MSEDDSTPELSVNDLLDYRKVRIRNIYQQEAICNSLLSQFHAAGISKEPASDAVKLFVHMVGDDWILRKVDMKKDAFNTKINACGDLKGADRDKIYQALCERMTICRTILHSAGSLVQEEHERIIERVIESAKEDYLRKNGGEK